ncbi:hypothetical protein AAG906_006005 [Vitis piasezkii]
MGVSEFLQTIKARVDELAILGLGEDYKELVFSSKHHKDQSYFLASNPPIVPTLGHETCHTLILPPETTQVGVHPPILATALRAGARRPPLVIDSLHPLVLTIYVQIAALQSLILATAKSAEFKDIQLSAVPLRLIPIETSTNTKTKNAKLLLATKSSLCC